MSTTQASWIFSVSTDDFQKRVVEKSHDVPVVTDRDSIPADNEHYADWAHMTDQGCASMAERFSRFLVAHRVVPEILAERERRGSTTETRH